MKLLLCLLAYLAAAEAQNCPSVGLAYFRDDVQCDKYYQCKNGVLTEQLCPDGLLFNDQLQDTRYPCMYPNEVNCGGRHRRQQPQPTPNCPNQFGYFGSGNSADCGYFYNCVNGVANRVTCPAGLAFSSITYDCEWPADAPGCNPEAYLRFTCPGPSDPGHPRFRSPYDCRNYFVCVGGSPRLLTCENGRVFNEEIGNCDRAENTRGCEDYYSGRR